MAYDELLVDSRMSNTYSLLGGLGRKGLCDRIVGPGALNLNRGWTEPTQNRLWMSRVSLFIIDTGRVFVSTKQALSHYCTFGKVHPSIR